MIASIRLYSQLIGYKSKQKALQSYDYRAFVGFDTLAESGGFEPADPVTDQQFSRLPQSTTLPTLRDKSTNTT